MRPPARGRFRPRSDGVPGFAVDARERLERALLEHLLGRVRHPAGAARQQDGRLRLRLADESGPADQVGSELHHQPVLDAVWRLGALAAVQLVLTPALIEGLSRELTSTCAKRPSIAD